jgi:hypothetical protein
VRQVVSPSQECYLEAMRKIFVVAIVIIMAVLVILLFIHEIRTPGESEPIVARHGEQKILTDTSFISKTKDPNINTYTSPSLGVRFDYAVVDPTYSDLPNAPKTKIFEQGNKIWASDGGSITIFEKNPNETLEQAVAQSVPDCKVAITTVNEPLDTQAQILFPDYKASPYAGAPQENLPLYEDIGDPVLTAKDQACLKEATYDPIYFAADETHPDRYVGVEFSTQAAEAVLYKNGDRVILWPSSVELIPKS